jgi:hypothetical protein
MNRKQLENAERAILNGKKTHPSLTLFDAKYESRTGFIGARRINGDAYDTFVVLFGDNIVEFIVFRSKWHWLLRHFPNTKDYWHYRLSKAHNLRQKALNKP